MKDYYKILGLDRSATPDQIKQAYRKLASKHHPDKGGDTGLFQDIQEAYAVLSDDQQRQAYDNPGIRINRSGMPPPFDINSMFEMFGQRPSHQDFVQSVRMQLWISLRDSVLGGKRAVALSSAQGQRMVEIDIPKGIEDNDTVRYAGMGPGGADLLVAFRIKPEHQWQRQDNNITSEISLPIWDLILGTTVMVESIHGNSLELTVPAMTQPNTLLRIRGHGVTSRRNPKPGDFFVRVNARIPPVISQQMLEQINKERGQ